MSPPDDDGIYFEPHYPCDTCGARDAEVIRDGEEGWQAICRKCPRRIRFSSDTPLKAQEDWEDTMWESQQDAKEDRRRDRD